MTISKIQIESEVVKMYKHYVVDVGELDELLNQVNEGKMEIISVVYASDSSQVICIVKQPEGSLVKHLMESKKVQEQK